MLWKPWVFLFGVHFSLDVTVKKYGPGMCEGFSENIHRTLDEASCESYEMSLIAMCKVEHQLDPIYCGSISIGVCLKGDFVAAEFKDRIKGVIYECTDPPTCDDNIMNGNEEDVDCGGDCSPCPSNCEDYVCNSSWSLVENPETKKCAGNPCNPNDLSTCCDRNALCSEFSGECNSSYVPISDENSTYCAGTQCRPSDHRLCCVHVGRCESFSLCDSSTEYLKEDADHLMCNADVCDESDILKCCAKKARCSSWQCDIDGGYTNIDNDVNVYCERDPCDEDDSDTCCTEREGLGSGGGSGLGDEAIAAIVVGVMLIIFVVAGFGWYKLKISKGNSVEEPQKLEITEQLQNCEAQMVKEA